MPRGIAVKLNMLSYKELSMGIWMALFGCCGKVCKNVDKIIDFFLLLC